MNRRMLTSAAAIALALSLMAVLPSCGADGGGQTDSNTTATTTSTTTATTTGTDDDLPDAAQIQQDLIGKSIVDPHLGEWFFEDLDEFLTFTIEDQRVTGDRAEFVVVMELKDINDGRLYRGRSTVVYTRDGSGVWGLESVSGEYRSAQPSV